MLGLGELDQLVFDVVDVLLGVFGSGDHRGRHDHGGLVGGEDIAVKDIHLRAKRTAIIVPLIHSIQLLLRIHRVSSHIVFHQILSPLNFVRVYVESHFLEFLSSGNFVRIIFSCVVVAAFLGLIPLDLAHIVLLSRFLASHDTRRHFRTLHRLRLR